MNDLLKNIDRKATQMAIEKVFRQYRTYMLTTTEDLLPKITTKYTLEMPNFSLYKSSSTENAAIQRASFSEDYTKFMKWFNRGFNRLNKIERQIITLTNLAEEPLHNYEIFVKLNLSERTFYRLKSNALYKLALFLGVIVYDNSDELKEALNKKFDLDGLKNAAINTGVDLTGASTKTEIIEAIIKQNKAKALLKEEVKV